MPNSEDWCWTASKGMSMLTAYRAGCGQAGNWRRVASKPLLVQGQLWTWSESGRCRCNDVFRVTFAYFVKKEESPLCCDRWTIT